MAVAAAALPAIAFLLPEAAGAAEPAGRAPAPELCLDLGIVVVDLGCPAPTTPATTAAPATTAPATTAAPAPGTTAAPATTQAPSGPGVTVPGLGGEPILDVDLTPNPTIPDTSNTVPATLLPGLPAIPEVLPGTPIADIEVNLPILNCDIGLALLAASADCNLGILGPILQPVLAPVLAPLADLPPILGLDLDVVLGVATGLVDLDAAVDTEGGIGDPDGVTGDVCLDLSVLSPNPGVCPTAVAPNGVTPGQAPSVIDANVCAGVGVLAEVPAVCPDGQSSGPGGSLIDADVCAGIAVLGGEIPSVCAGGEGGGGGLIDVDLCLGLALLGQSPAICPTVTTVAPGGGTTSTTLVGPATTDPGSPTTTPGGGTTPGGPTTTPGGGPGNRPTVNDPGGELPVTGIAIAGMLLAAAVLVATGAGARLLARVPGRRGA